MHGIVIFYADTIDENVSHDEVHRQINTYRSSDVYLLNFHVRIDTSFAQYRELVSITRLHEKEQGTHALESPPPPPSQEYDPHLDITSPEYKQRRLLAILQAPIESHSTERMEKLAISEHTTVMRGFSQSLHQLRDDERRLKHDMSAAIKRQRDLMPLKFLFELPGGIGYCRDRLQKALRVWIEEFELNQQRVAWIQWKAVAEKVRFRIRQGYFLRQSALKRMRIAIDLIVRAFWQKGWHKWVITIQMMIWLDRDNAIRKIQPHARGYIARQRCLAFHDANPINGYFADMYLASPRTDVPFHLPLRIREERRQIWQAAIRVQAPYRGRKCRKFMKRQRQAARKIQALVRKRQFVIRYHTLRQQIILIQAEIRRWLARTRFLALRAAACILQRNLRGRRGRRFIRLAILAERRCMETKWHSTLLLQRMVRGWLARRAALAIRTYNMRCLRAALLIQKAWYARNNEWSTFLLLGCLREREVDETQWAKNLAFHHRVQSAKRIQLIFRRFIVARQNHLVHRIQQQYRRFHALRILTRLKREYRAHCRIKWWFRTHHARRHRMAAKLQVWWRRSVPGRMLRYLKRVARMLFTAEIRSWQEREYDAATTLQAMMRGVWTRLFVKKTRHARTIQRYVRGFLARRKVHRMQSARRHERATSFYHVLVLPAVIDTREWFHRSNLSRRTYSLDILYIH
jgi:hypothetical protein